MFTKLIYILSCKNHCNFLCHSMKSTMFLITCMYTLFSYSFFFKHTKSALFWVKMTLLRNNLQHIIMNPITTKWTNADIQFHCCFFLQLHIYILGPFFTSHQLTICLTIGHLKVFINICHITQNIVSTIVKSTYTFINKYFWNINFIFFKITG